MEDMSKLAEQYDKDSALKSKGKVVFILSLILLSLTFSGANIEEANTFIFKINFTNQNGLSWLLFIAIIFSTLRYYNFSKRYHDWFYRLWTGRLLKQPALLNYCDSSGDVAGLTVDLFTKSDFMHYMNAGHINASYKCRFPLRRFIEIQYFEHDEPAEYKEYRVPLRKYWTILRLEIRERFNSFVSHREALDILGPYIISIFSIISFVFKEEVIQMIKCLSI